MDGLQWFGWWVGVLAEMWLGGGVERDEADFSVVE